MELYKYKLKELDLGDKDLNKGIRTTVIDTDPEQNSTSWKVEYNVDMGAPILKLNEVIESLNGVVRYNKTDEHLRLFLDYIKGLRNKYRAYIRSNYPDEYEVIKRKKEYMKEEVEGLEEESSSAGAGSYNTPFAFNKNKKADGASLKYYYRLGFKKVPTKVKGSRLEVKKLWSEDKIYIPWFMIKTEKDKDENLRKTENELRDIVLKNLERNPNYYSKNKPENNPRREIEYLNKNFYKPKQ